MRDGLLERGGMATEREGVNLFSFNARGLKINLVSKSSQKKQETYGIFTGTQTEHLITTLQLKCLFKNMLVKVMLKHQSTRSYLYLPHIEQNFY